MVGFDKYSWRTLSSKYYTKSTLIPHFLGVIPNAFFGNVDSNIKRWFYGGARMFTLALL